MKNYVSDKTVYRWIKKTSLENEREEIDYKNGKLSE